MHTFSSSRNSTSPIRSFLSTTDTFGVRASNCVSINLSASSDIGVDDYWCNVTESSGYVCGQRIRMKNV
ncbi:unnamed protein product [Caenorhabditis sp. 36 PRJEB53466]|nr:unnamed protein product [Caenorhabditis sp. 36 PRJEB53466]